MSIRFSSQNKILFIQIIFVNKKFQFNANFPE